MHLLFSLFSSHLVGHFESYLITLGSLRDLIRFLLILLPLHSKKHSPFNIAPCNHRRLFWCWNLLLFSQSICRRWSMDGSSFYNLEAMDCRCVFNNWSVKLLTSVSSHDLIKVKLRLHLSFILGLNKDTVECIFV